MYNNIYVNNQTIVKLQENLSKLQINGAQHSKVSNYRKLSELV